MEELVVSTEPAAILVIEDDEDTAEFLCMLLSDAGYTATIAGDGATALRLLQSTPVDLVLTDLMLPGMDGYAVTEHIREDVDPTLPVIMLTAAGQPQSKMRGFNSGIDDFIAKPFNGDELLARIATQLRWSRAKRNIEDQSEFLQAALANISQQEQAASANLRIETSMRGDLLRSVNTHLQSLCRIFESEFRRQPPGGGREALLRVMPRLRQAALVYQIADFLNGETADFAMLLRMVTASLKSISATQKNVVVTVEAGQVELPAAIASPLAMIVSELVTNAFRHAFPDRRRGTLTLRCWQSKDRLHLEVEDDGVGIPAAATEARGLLTVRQLAASLGGTFDIDTGDKGTCVSIVAPHDQC